MPTVPSNLEGALLATAFVFAVFTVDLGTLALCFLPAVEADAVRGGAPRGAAGSALDAKSAGRRCAAAASRSLLLAELETLRLACSSASSAARAAARRVADREADRTGSSSACAARASAAPVSYTHLTLPTKA